MPEFKGTEQNGEPPSPAPDTARAIAHLPGLDIEITHRRAAEGDAEHISINLKAVPSFEAFGRAFQAANPFALWMRGIELAWLPWIEATRAMSLPWAQALPWTQAPSLTPPESDAGPERKDGSAG